LRGPGYGGAIFRILIESHTAFRIEAVRCGRMVRETYFGKARRGGIARVFDRRSNGVLAKRGVHVIVGYRIHVATPTLSGTKTQA